MTTPLVALDDLAFFHRLTIADYYAMSAAGILTENDAVELLEGMLIAKMTKNRPHSRANKKILDLLAHHLDTHNYYVDAQEPILTADSVPEPDVFIVRGSPDDYVETHPRAEHVLLVVEISDSTLNLDRMLKARLYARAGIPVYWIVNLNDRVIEVYTQPISDDAPRYTAATVYSKADSVPFTLDGVEITRVPVADMLP